MQALDLADKGGYPGLMGKSRLREWVLVVFLFKVQGGVLGARFKSLGVGSVGHAQERKSLS